MGNTTRGYVYPEDPDLVDVPGDMQAALESVDADVAAVETLATTGDNKADANAVDITDLQAQVTLLAADIATTVAKMPSVWVAERTTSVTGIGTTPLDILTVTFDAVTGRRYRAHLYLPAVVGSGATNRFVVELMDGSTRLTRAYLETRQAGSSADLSISLTYVSPATLSGPQSWKARIAIDAFGSNGTAAGVSTSPIHLTVESLLPQGG